MKLQDFENDDEKVIQDKLKQKTFIFLSKQYFFNRGLFTKQIRLETFLFY